MLRGEKMDEELEVQPCQFGVRLRSLVYDDGGQFYGAEKYARLAMERAAADARLWLNAICKPATPERP
jgi:hypothetical protein